MRPTSKLIAAVLLAVILPACGKAVDISQPTSTAAPVSGKTATAIFAGGCYWCMEQAFDQVPGVLQTISGYTGGAKVDPTYEEVSSGTTGHAEAEKIIYDPSKVTYKQLLYDFWHNVDPTNDHGQFCDNGNQYRSEIFYLNDEQKKEAEASRQALENQKGAPSPIVTKIVKAGPFYKAEEYMQNYYKKNPLRYKYYHYACGRAARLRELWGKSALGQN